MLAAVKSSRAPRPLGNEDWRYKNGLLLIGVPRSPEMREVVKEG